MLISILMESAILVLTFAVYLLNKQAEALKKELDEVAKLPLTVIHASDKQPGLKVYGDMTLKGNVYSGGNYGDCCNMDCKLCDWLKQEIEFAYNLAIERTKKKELKDEC